MQLGRRIDVRIVFELFAFAVLLVIPSLAEAKPSANAFSRGPTPPWVAPRPPPGPRSSDGGDAPVVDLVIDDQLLTGPTVERYIRRSRRINALAGVEDGSEIEVEVDPSYQGFVLHHLEIVRGDRRIDALATADVRVLDAEDSRDKRIYNGTTSIVFVLADVRVGDIVEWDGSIVGQNPVYGGLVARRFSLASARPARFRRVRIVSPAGRSFATRVEQTDRLPRAAPAGERNEIVWEREDVQAVAEQTDTPRWFESTPSLSISEYASWADVARWAARLYDTREGAGPALAAKISEIAAAHDAPEKRALAALRFVQDEVRYLGIELGEHTHRPHPASKVLEQRFGDCKDKTMLLITILRALGIEAHAALVNTDLEGHVRNVLPAPNVFDHVITRIRIGTKDYWVDATRSLERGPLGAAPVHFGYALLAARDVVDLTKIDVAPLDDPTKEVVETIRFAGDKASLEVATTYRGLSADALRAQLDAGQRANLEKDYLAYYVRQYPRASRIGTVAFDDDEERGVIVLRESYDLPSAAEDGTLATWAEALAPIAAKPQDVERTGPLDVRFPAFVRHSIVVEGAPFAPPEAVFLVDDAMEYRRRAERTAKGVAIVHEIRTSKDHVPHEAEAKHLELRAKIRTALELALVRSTSTTAAAAPKKGATLELALTVGALFVSVFIGAAVVVALKLPAWRRLRWRGRVAAGAGSDATRPLHAETRHEAEGLVRREACECGKRRPAGSGQVAWTSMTLGGEPITAGRLECPSCGAARVRYFRLQKDDVEAGP